MKWILGPAARLVERRPWWAIGIVAAVTAALSVFAVQQQSDTDIASFAPDTAIGRAFFQMEEQLGAGSAVQVVVDAGEGGNVVSPAGVRAVLEIEALLEADPEVVGALAPAGGVTPPVWSFADPVAAVLAAEGIDPAAAAPEQVAAAAVAAYASDDAALAAALTSGDADLTVPSARAGMVLVRFRAGLSDVETGEAALAVREALAGVAPEGVTVEVFSLEVLWDEMQKTMDRELGPLLGLAFGLVVLILIFFYRRVSDVVVGVIGLLLAIVWMYGIGTLLGPSYLGWVGAFTQISIAVPVLLVGLGIDYAVHLTSRYREERSRGTAPDAAARRAMLTVGGALVLATITTLVGFLTNLASPIPPIGDFGVFAAIGVLSAFVVMAFLVPSVRNVLDRRRARREDGPPGDPLRHITGVMRSTTVLATRIPWVTLGFAAAVMVVSIVVASGLTTEFSQEEFIPEGSEAQRLLGVIDGLFGGDVVEETGIVVTGDVLDADVANAMLATEANLAGTPDVRMAGDRAQVSSPASVLLLARRVAAEEDPAAAERFADLGMLEAGFAPDADIMRLLLLARDYVPVELGSVIAVDEELSGMMEGTGAAVPDDVDLGQIVRGRWVAALRVATQAGEERAGELEAALTEDADPLVAAGADIAVTSRNLLIAEVGTTLTAAQQRSIVVTLVVALLLLVAYYWVTERRPMLGVVTMIPSVLVVAWTLGTMRLMGLTFNVLTGTIASLTIGIGVPYGIHVTHRFVEDFDRTGDVVQAVRITMGHTGAALAGAALTTAAGFGVLRLSSIIPLQQFGAMTAITIVYSLAGAVLAQPSCLVLWGRMAQWRESRRA
ncbi:MAG: MMPL family transporter [Actinobacteria bacterium]|nr:MMPL family transporter [Actinomycetota bacterium]